LAAKPLELSRTHNDIVYAKRAFGLTSLAGVVDFAPRAMSRCRREKPVLR